MPQSDPLSLLLAGSEVESIEVDSKISMEIRLQSHENEYLSDSGYYQVQSFQMMADNAEELCQTMNCQYELEDGEFRENSYTGGYVLEGRLKATIREDDAMKSNFSKVYADLEKAGSEETSSKLIEILEGNIVFGGIIFQPETEYEVVNGTLNVDQ